MNNEKIIEEFDRLIKKNEENEQRLRLLEEKVNILNQNPRVYPAIELGIYDWEILYDDTETINDEEEDDDAYYMYKYHVKFSRKFTSAPKIFLSLTSTIHSEDCWVHFEKVNRSGFDLIIESCWDYDEYKNVALVVSWLAIED